MTKRNKAPPTWRRLLPAVDSVTIVGLGGIGRQVAVQLAALGVPRLQLVDARTVSRSNHAAEGYPFEDVGRLLVHAAAQQGHQINPQLHVDSITRRSLKAVDLGDAVLCCPGSLSVWRAVGRQAHDSSAVACCDVIGGTIRVGFARGATSLPEVLGKTTPPETARRSARRSTVPVHVATVAAGLLVVEFIRFAAGDQAWRAVRFDLQSLRADIKEPR